MAIVFTLIFLLQSHLSICQSSKGWETQLNNIGTHSSPRAADLNNDGVKDIIIGCSKKEFEKNDTAIIAIDGATGKILWKSSARDQMYGSAALLDINRDSVPILSLEAGQQNFRHLMEKTGK